MREQLIVALSFPELYSLWIWSDFYGIYMLSCYGSIVVDHDITSSCKITFYHMFTFRFWQWAKLTQDSFAGLRADSEFFYWHKKSEINSQRLEDTQVGYITQKYTLEKYPLVEYTEKFEEKLRKLKNQTQNWQIIRVRFLQLFT